MSSLEWAASALQAFDGVVQASTGFRSREGQRHMAERVATTLAAATLGKPRHDDGADGDDGPADAPTRAIAVIQAGTGVGKSLAYCAPAIALALARNTRVVISTATVALQEQLVHKDLPALAKLLPQPFRFALAKGRGRYVCQLKLGRLTGLADEFPGREVVAGAEALVHQYEAAFLIFHVNRLRDDVGLDLRISARSASMRARWPDRVSRVWA